MYRIFITKFITNKSCFYPPIAIITGDLFVTIYLLEQQNDHCTAKESKILDNYSYYLGQNLVFHLLYMYRMLINGLD